MLVKGFTHAQYGSQSAECTGRGSLPPLYRLSCCARREKKHKSTWSTLDSKTRSAARSTQSFGRRLDCSRLFSGHTGHRIGRSPDLEAENSSFCASVLSVLPGVGGRVFLGDVAPQPRCVFGCPPKRVLCDSRCNTKLPELELGQKPPIFVSSWRCGGGGFRAIRYPA